MIEFKDQDGKPIPGLPVSAIFIDGEGKVVAVTQILEGSKISGVKNLLNCSPGPADPEESVIEVTADIAVNPPASSDLPLTYITAVKYCTNKLGNRVVCPAGS